VSDHCGLIIDIEVKSEDGYTGADESIGSKTLSTKK